MKTLDIIPVINLLILMTVIGPASVYLYLSRRRKDMFYGDRSQFRYDKWCSTCPHGVKRIEHRAEYLYEVYRSTVGGKALNGAALPKWPEFRKDPAKTKQVDAWIAIARAS